ncbi:MAG: mechanosensitive ion channel family protein [Rhizobiaceae bacterium]
MTPQPSPAEAASAPAADASAAAPPVATISPSPSAHAAAGDTVEAAEGIKKAVTSENQTVGALIERLDSYAINVGNMHISAWSAAIVLLIVIGVIVFARLGSSMTHRLLGRVTRLDSTQKVLFEKLTSLAVWLIAILVGLDFLGIDLTALTVFSGAFGLALGFGLQKTFGNLIAGIILLMDRSIKPGDVIAVTDMAGQESFGQIRKIGIRAVSVVTRDRKEYLIPNENLMVNQVENWSYSSRHVRIQVPVGISYKADLRLAEELMLQAARACSRVLDSPAPGIWMDSYGDSSVNFVIQCWIMDPEEGVGNVRSEVLKNLWWLLKEHEVEIPFPQRDINLRDSEAFRELLEALRPGAARTTGSKSRG